MFESIPIQNDSREKEQRINKKEKLLDQIKRTKKVVGQLIAWGMLALPAVSSAESLKTSDASENVKSASSIEFVNKNVQSKIQSREDTIKEGLDVEKSDKPVIAIVTEADLDGKEEPNSDSKIGEEFAKEEILYSAFSSMHDKYSFLERSQYALNAINEELRFQASGLVDEKTRVTPKYLKPDVYVVVSNMGDEFTVRIINMKTGGEKKIVHQLTKEENSNTDGKLAFVKKLSAETNSIIDQI